MPSNLQTAIRETITSGAMKVAGFNRKRLTPPETPHPFITGIHAPVDSELTVTDLMVTGAIPPDLNGRYVRIGPNPITPPDPASHHWFLGDGMVHGVRISGGKALWYRNRWIRSNAVSAALGEPPAPGIRNPRTDVVNTNVLGIAGETWAVVEAGGSPVRISEELDTIAHDPFGGTLKGSFTAHPHRDPDSGEMHAICYSAAEHNVIHHVVIDTAGRVRREEPIAVKHGPSIHDCMITKSYVIVFDLPVTFSVPTLLAGHPFPYRWNPAHKARVGLLPREGSCSDIIWCDVDPAYVFHPCNAYETDAGHVIVDVAAHATMFADSTFGPDSQTTPFERWKIDPVARRVERDVIDETSQEFPRPDERRLGKYYRYAYTMALPPKNSPHAFSDHKLFKHDLETRSRETHDFGPDRYPGEFVFVPKHPDAAEDEGWVMGYVVNLVSQTTDLVILDAQNFSGDPQAVITIPCRIPAGFHGNWIPSIAG